MPIYAYRCSQCGHQKDVLQKLADPHLTECPACHTQNFARMLTAAGFVLKGGGWYATDFKGAPAATAPGKDQGETAPDASAKASEAGAPAPAPSSGHACGSGGCGACA